MKRSIILFACMALSACAAGNTGAKFSASHINLGLPPISAPAPPVAQPRACAADLLADPLTEPALPDDAYFPAPEDSNASLHTTNYLIWLHAHEHWAKEGWRLAGEGKATCKGTP